MRADGFLRSMQDGYVHVMLRQLPNASDTPPGKVKIELSVIDTGKVRTNTRSPPQGSPTDAHIFFFFIVGYQPTLPEGREYSMHTAEHEFTSL